MTQGIRTYANSRFAKLVPKLAELGNAGFRAKVITDVMSKFDIPAASAATHYNFAFKAFKAVDPAAVAGLGRAEDKKGGRKPIHVVDVIKVKTGEVVAAAVSRGAAELLITRAAAARKAKLAIKVDVAVTA